MLYKGKKVHFLLWLTIHHRGMFNEDWIDGGNIKGVSCPKESRTFLISLHCELFLSLGHQGQVKAERLADNWQFFVAVAGFLRVWYSHEVCVA